MIVNPNNIGPVTSILRINSTCKRVYLKRVKRIVGILVNHQLSPKTLRFSQNNAIGTILLLRLQTNLIEPVI